MLTCVHAHTCMYGCMCLFTVFRASFSSALKVLLEHGVDVNLQDEFSSVYRVARQKKYDSYAGVLVNGQVIYLVV